MLTKINSAGGDEWFQGFNVIQLVETRCAKLNMLMAYKAFPQNNQHSYRLPLNSIMFHWKWKGGGH